jgi:hypothetical protein
MDLTCGERLILARVFPGEVPPLLVGIASRLQTDLLLTEEEIEEFGVVMEGPSVHWNPAVDTAREIKVGPRGKQLLADALTNAPALPASPVVAGLLDKFGVALDDDD